MHTIKFCYIEKEFHKCFIECFKIIIVFNSSIMSFYMEHQSQRDSSRTDASSEASSKFSASTSLTETTWYTFIMTGFQVNSRYPWSSSGGEPGVFDGSMIIIMFLLCVRNFPIEHVRFLDTCSNMAAINNNFEFFTFMNEICWTRAVMHFFLLMGLYNVNPRDDLPKLHVHVENIILQFLEEVFHAFWQFWNLLSNILKHDKQ